MNNAGETATLWVILLAMIGLIFYVFSAVKKDNPKPQKEKTGELVGYIYYGNECVDTIHQISAVEKGKYITIYASGDTILLNPGARCVINEE